MNKLKIVSPGWETYSGWLGPVQFDNGVSVDPVPQRFADRIAATVRVEEITDKGKTVGQAGAAARLKGGATVPAEVKAPLPTASEDDLKAEAERDAAEAAEKARLDKITKIFTEDELEQIADKEGIKGLRVVGDTLGVRGRAIPELIGDILTAQEKLKTAEAGERLVKGAEAETPAEPEAPVEPAAEETETEEPASQEDEDAA